MNKSQWIAILDKAAALGCFKINLVYGEPFLFEHIFEFIIDATDRDYDVEISTNGSIMDDEKARTLWNIGIRKIQISIDFPDNRHDDYRGYPGALESAIKTAKILRQYPFRIKIITTQSPSNSIYYDQMLSLSESVGADMLYFLPARSSVESAEKNNRLQGLIHIHRLINKTSHIKILCHDPLFVEKFGTKHGEGCLVGNILHIAPNGGASLCPLWQMSVGNVFRDGLENIWIKTGNILTSLNKRKMDMLCHAAASF